MGRPPPVRPRAGPRAKALERSLVLWLWLLLLLLLPILKALQQMLPILRSAERVITVKNGYFIAFFSCFYSIFLNHIPRTLILCAMLATSPLSPPPPFPAISPFSSVFPISPIFPDFKILVCRFGEFRGAERGCL